MQICKEKNNLRQKAFNYTIHRKENFVDRKRIPR